MIAEKYWITRNLFCNHSNTFFHKLISRLKVKNTFLIFDSQSWNEFVFIGYSCCLKYADLNRPILIKFQVQSKMFPMKTLECIFYSFFSCGHGRVMGYGHAVDFSCLTVHPNSGLESGWFLLSKRTNPQGAFDPLLLYRALLSKFQFWVWQWSSRSIGKRYITCRFQKSRNKSKVRSSSLYSIQINIFREDGSISFKFKLPDWGKKLKFN